ncbi:phosphoacetylglucosamine mutase [Pseudozyma hubeiensis SY62]|uniref:Phosphoacetylglucosamine mutase n=1 Tax=Pseudozyma hubeiensis (strain SY62) TaxID=1305764 RepID=R9P5S0_PSEHS|nr:phosphoacetylglucosamine mutase [Pseudozyma hubeiensis SY62]GAC93440.1 phosphoacetylglucosamine mutase [Pseudozyma hubeiensis SY62]
MNEYTRSIRTTTLSVERELTGSENSRRESLRAPGTSLLKDLVYAGWMWSCDLRTHAGIVSYRNRSHRGFAFLYSFRIQAQARYSLDTFRSHQPVTLRSQDPSAPIRHLIALTELLSRHYAAFLSDLTLAIPTLTFQNPLVFATRLIRPS